MDDADQQKTLVSCGFLFLGLCSVGASSLFYNTRKTSVGEVTRRNMVPWSPVGFLGTGQRSPIFGFMWTSIYLLAGVSVVSLLIAGLGRVHISSQNNVLWACVAAFLCFFVSGFWRIFYVQETPTSFVISSVILLLCCASSGVACFLVNPFASLDNSWAEDVCGCSFAILFGWVLIAFTLSVGTTTRVYNRGVGSMDTEEQSHSWWPMILGIIAIILASSFFNGLLAVPLLASSFFFKGFRKSWKVWIASVLAAVAVAVGVSLTLLDRYAI